MLKTAVKCKKLTQFEGFKELVIKNSFNKKPPVNNKIKEEDEIL